MEVRRVALDTGVHLAVADRDGQIPVVLLHAWGETHEIFSDLLPLLPGDLRLVVPDQRGVGDSDRPSSGYEFADAADDIRGLLDALGIDRAWLVGASSGGYLAQRVAVDHPDRIAGLLLVGAPRSLRGIGDPFGAALRGLGDPITPQKVDALVGGIPTVQPIPWEVMQRNNVAATTIPAHVWRVTYQALLDATAPTDDGTIDAPTLIMWGADDALLPRSDADLLHQAIGGSELTVYPDTGHLVLLERTQWVARDIADFLHRHS